MRKAILHRDGAAATATRGLRARAAARTAGPATTRNFPVGGVRPARGRPAPMKSTVTHRRRAVGARQRRRAGDRADGRRGRGRHAEDPHQEALGHELRLVGSSHRSSWRSPCPRLRGAEIAGSGRISVDKVARRSSRPASPDRASCGSARSTSNGSRSASPVRARSTPAAAAPRRPNMRSPDRATSTPARWSPKTAAVSIAGSGEVAANATGTAPVDIVGSGDVRMTGGAKCTVSKAGSGNVRCS